MKLAVLKLGARIAKGGTSGGSGEALAILDILSRNNDVDAYTKILAKDGTIPNVHVHQILDEYSDISADALIVINGGVNYFGGVDSPEQTINYHVINNFSGPVFYIMCDPSLALKQIWPSVRKKEWANNYNESDINIVRDDIIYISQPKNVDKIHTDFQKYVKFKECLHFPFEKFPLLSNPMEFKSLESRTYDLLYGGTFRSGRRQDDMIKYYFGYDDDVVMFGKIKESNFNIKKIGELSYPKFEKSVKYQDFNDKMSNSIATVIIGDKYYKETDDLAQRIYENILAGVVTFIDADYDRNKRVYNDETLRNFLYVTDRHDVQTKLNVIKAMSEKSFRELLARQYDDVKLDITKYCTQLSDIIKGKL